MGQGEGVEDNPENWVTACIRFMVQWVFNKNKLSWIGTWPFFLDTEWRHERCSRFNFLIELFLLLSCVDLWRNVVFYLTFLFFSTFGLYLYQESILVFLIFFCVFGCVYYLFDRVLTHIYMYYIYKLYIYTHTNY